MAARKSSGKRRPGPKVDAYQVVTDKIVAALTAGVVPWHQPWRTGAAGNLPLSLSTRRAYRGSNVFVLGITAMIEGYSSRWWGTYNQVKERGGQVRGGEKGTQIVKVLTFDVDAKPDDEDADERGKRKAHTLRAYTVFNLDQVDGLDDPTPLRLDDHERLPTGDEIVEGYKSRGGPVVRDGGDQASYNPPTDVVRMPLLGQFESTATYYATLFHELAHSTGHKSRLDRDLDEPAPFGSPDYSREELVAEMTAAFVCGAAGIDVHVPAHAGYIDHWLGKLGSDPKLVVQAAGQAQKAADLILDRVPDRAPADATAEIASSETVTSSVS